MTIQNWPHSERPREKLIEKGVGSLSDAELLALFLQTGRPGQSAVEVARELLQAFSGLGNVLMADQQTFCAQPGMGIARYALLQAALELSRRHVYCEIRESIVSFQAAQ